MTGKIASIIASLTEATANEVTEIIDGLSPVTLTLISSRVNKVKIAKKDELLKAKEAIKEASEINKAKAKDEADSLGRKFATAGKTVTCKYGKVASGFVTGIVKKIGAKTVTISYTDDDGKIVDGLWRYFSDIVIPEIADEATDEETT